LQSSVLLSFVSNYKFFLAIELRLTVGNKFFVVSVEKNYNQCLATKMEYFLLQNLGDLSAKIDSRNKFFAISVEKKTISCYKGICFVTKFGRSCQLRLTVGINFSLLM